MYASKAWLVGTLGWMLAAGCTAGSPGQLGFDDEDAAFGPLDGKADSNSADSKHLWGKFQNDAAEIGYVRYLELHEDFTFFAAYQLNKGDAPSKVAGRYGLTDGDKGLALALELTNCKSPVNALKKAYDLAIVDKSVSGDASAFELRQIATAGQPSVKQSLKRCTECEFGEPVPVNKPQNEARYRAKTSWVKLKSSTPTDFFGSLPDAYVCVGQYCTPTNMCIDRLECALDAYVRSCTPPPTTDSTAPALWGCQWDVKGNGELLLSELKDRMTVSVLNEDPLWPDSELGSTQLPFDGKKLQYELTNFGNVDTVKLTLEQVDGTGLPVPNTGLPACKLAPPTPSMPSTPPPDQSNPPDMVMVQVDMAKPIDMTSPPDLATQPDLAHPAYDFALPAEADPAQPTQDGPKQPGCSYGGGGPAPLASLLVLLAAVTLLRRRRRA